MESNEDKQDKIDWLRRVSLRDVWVELEGVDREDHPDYSDAYIVSGRWRCNKQPLTEEEIDILNDHNRDLICERANQW